MAILFYTVSGLGFPAESGTQVIAHCITLHLQPFSITHSQTNTAAVMATEVCNIMFGEPVLRLSAPFVAGNLFNCDAGKESCDPSWALNADGQAQQAPL